MITRNSHRTRAVLSFAGLLVTAAITAGFATSAGASSLTVSASPNPAVSGAQVTLTNSGTRDDPLLSTVVYDYYEPNTASCAATASEARGRSHGDGYVATLELPEAMTFTEQTAWVPAGAATAYRICAFLVSGGDDSAAPEATGTAILQVPLTRAQLLARALKSCRRIHMRARRTRCVRLAQRRYGTPH